MKITVTAAEPKDNEVAAKLTISQQDVDNAVKGAYKDIANKYSFKGFRRGRTPRPVIDSLIGCCTQGRSQACRKDSCEGRSTCCQEV